MVAIPNCTATLIAPSVLLTAAHCVAGGFGRNPVGASVVVGTESFPVSRCEIHHLAMTHGDTGEPFMSCGESGDYTLNSSHDLAVLTLSGRVTTVAPIRMDLSRASLALGTRVTSYGFAPCASCVTPDTRRSLISTVTAWSPSNGVIAATAEPGDSGGPVVLAGKVIAVHSAATNDTAVTVLSDAQNSDFIFRHAGGTSVTSLAGDYAPVSGCVSGTGSDVDCDGVPNVADNCPRTANPNQLDSDRDGRGDACDSCVTAPNADQRNCNAVAEMATGAAASGDACDSRPFACFQSGVSYSDATRVTIHASSAVMNTSGSSELRFRFCPCPITRTGDAATDRDSVLRCARPISQGGYGCTIPTTREAAAAELQTAASPWRTMSLEVDEASGPVLDPSVTVDRRASAPPISWARNVDAARYGIAPDAFGRLTMRGVLWTHVVPFADTTSRGQDPDTGRTVEWVTRAASPELANNFELIDVGTPLVVPDIQYVFTRPAWVHFQPIPEPFCLACGELPMRPVTLLRDGSVFRIASVSPGGYAPSAEIKSTAKDLKNWASSASDSVASSRPLVVAALGTDGTSLAFVATQSGQSSFSVSREGMSLSRSTPADSLIVTPEGTVLALGGSDLSVLPATAKAPTTKKLTSAEFRWPTYHPGIGRLLVTHASPDGKSFSISAISLVSGGASVMAYATGKPLGLAVAPDGSVIALSVDDESGAVRALCVDAVTGALTGQGYPIANPGVLEFRAHAMGLSIRTEKEVLLYPYEKLGLLAK